MAKKRGNIADGIKVAYEVHQALEAVQNVTAPKVREFIDGVKEMALMAAALIAVVGGLWLISSLFAFFKKAIM
jgi:hypothetical protein